MGYLAAVLNKHNQDASQTIIRMLKNASIGPSLTYGIADYNKIESGRDVQDFTEHTNEILLASKNVFPENYPPNPIQQGNHSLVFNGTLLDTNTPDSLSAANCLENNPTEGIKELISRRTGFYAVAAITKTTIVAGIDNIGTIPLYFGENNDNIALASNMKMLWAIRIRPQPLKPGHLLTITKKKSKIQKIKTLEKPRTKCITSTETLHKIMEETSQEYTNKFPKVTVAFSGGIDSNLVAHYLNKNNAKIELIWTGIEGQPEQEIAQKAADYLGLQLHLEIFTQEDIEQTLESILLSIEEPDPIKTGVAFPFHWASDKTYRLGYSSMYSGNGADEIFGGYKRYSTKYIEGSDPSEDLYQDVLNSYINNFHRDTKTCIDNGIRLLLPYTHPRLINYALRIPITQKLSKNLDEPRKKILRKLATAQGIPNEFARRPKKAAQYSSGVNKTLRKIAKKQGMTIKELVKTGFAKALAKSDLTFC